MKKYELIKKYFPEFTREDPNYFKLPWLDKSINKLVEIYKSNSRKLNKNHKRVLNSYINDSLQDIENFAEAFRNSPIVKLAFKKCLKDKTIETSQAYKSYLEIINLTGYCNLFLMSVLILRETEKREKFEELEIYCNGGLNDTKI